MNLLEKICKELGVEVGEKWLANDGYYYKITEDGMIGFYFPTSGYEKDFDIDHQLWVNLMTGDLKPVWKPEYGQPYYTPNPSYKPEINRYDRLTYEEDLYDEWCIKNNMAYKTKEEAIAAANKMLKAIKGGEII